MNQLETTKNTVRDLLDTRRDWQQIGEGHAVLEIDFRHEMGKFAVVVGVQDDPHLVVIYVRLPFVVPESKRSAMAEAVVRANYGATLGRFDLCMRSGDLCFAVAIPLLDGELHESQLDHTLRSALSHVVVFHRAFGRLLFDDDLSPAEVIAEVEMASKEKGSSRS